MANLYIIPNNHFINSCPPSGMVEVLMSSEMSQAWEVQGIEKHDNQSPNNGNWEGVYTSILFSRCPCFNSNCVQQIFIQRLLLARTMLSADQLHGEVKHITHSAHSGASQYRKEDKTHKLTFLIQDRIWTFLRSLLHNCFSQNLTVMQARVSTRVYYLRVLIQTNILSRHSQYRMI